MTGRTHLLAGAAAGAALLCSQGLGPVAPVQLAAVGAAACLGALLPDLDHPQSLLSRKAGPVGAVPGLFLRHRGPTHSLAAALATWAGASWLCAAQGLPHAAALAALAGYLSHLALDALTPGGVPLLWPLWGRRVGLPLVRTGSGLEGLAGLAILGALLWLAWRGPLPGVMLKWLRL